MSSADEIVIPPSLPRLLVAMFVGFAGVVGGLFLIFGPGVVVTTGATVAGGAGAGVVVLGLMTGRPCVRVDDEGFEFLTLIGGKRVRWADVASPFGLVKLGWNKGVGYALSDSARARLGSKPKPMFSGYDGVIGGALRTSPNELAALLNERLKVHLERARAAATEGEDSN
jgi:hypothetical protein